MSFPNVETDEATRLAIIKENHERSASEILDCYQKAQLLAADAKADAQAAVKEALKCGAMCNAKKMELGHGHWLKWHEQFLPEIDLSTVERWMKMANSCHDTIMSSEPKSLRQAYIAIGILPDPVTGQRKRLNGESQAPKGFKNNTSALGAIHALYSEKSIEALIQTLDFSSWDTINLEIMVRELEPITSMRSRMIHALSAKLRTAAGSA
jgi:hypothetical protein